MPPAPFASAKGARASEASTRGMPGAAARQRSPRHPLCYHSHVMNLGWHFDKMGRMGGSHSGAYRNPLSNSGLVKEHKLAREAIQNSVDARRENGIVQVHFRQQSVDEQRINQIADHLQLLSPTGPTERGMSVQALGLAPGHFFEAALDADTHPQKILFIEDYQTLGLGGNLNGSFQAHDRYYRLILGFGVDDETEESRGGSYGFGKSVYPDASNTNTVAYYSVFDPSNDTDGVHARLIVASLFNTHMYNGETYTGRAWFGEVRGDDFCAPLTDAAAHEFAALLGFKVRSPSETGTSMMILGSDARLGEIKTGVENHWWPRLIDDELVVKFWDDESKLADPDPHSQTQLQPYIRCYQMAAASKQDDQEDLVSQRFRRSGSLNVGYCAVTFAEPNAFPEEDDALEPMLYPGLNEVALIRSPKMVVAYQALRGGVDVVATFVADTDIDGILKLSEPSDHTRWARDSNRLKERAHKQLVQGIPNRINRTVEALRRKTIEDVDESAGSPKALEELLGDVLSTHRGGGATDHDRSTSPFDVRVAANANHLNGEASVSGAVQIQCRDRVKVDVLKCKTSLSAYIVNDDTRRPGEPIAVTITNVIDSQGRHLTPTESASCKLWVDKSSPAMIVFQTSSYAGYEMCNVKVDAEVAD